MGGGGVQGDANFLNKPIFSIRKGDIISPLPQITPESSKRQCFAHSTEDCCV